MRRTACGVLHTAYCILRYGFTPLCAVCCINITEATDIEPHCSSRAFQAFVGNLSVPLSFHVSFLLQLCIGRLVLPCQSSCSFVTARPWVNPPSACTAPPMSRSHPRENSRSRARVMLSRVSASTRCSPVLCNGRSGRHRSYSSASLIRRSPGVTR